LSINLLLLVVLLLPTYRCHAIGTTEHLSRGKSDRFIVSGIKLRTVPLSLRLGGARGERGRGRGRERKRRRRRRRWWRRRRRRRRSWSGSGSCWRRRFTDVEEEEKAICACFGNLFERVSLQRKQRKHCHLIIVLARGRARRKRREVGLHLRSN